MGQSILGRSGGAPPAAMRDFFVCDVPWAVPKDDMASMEHPLFTLATRPDRRILRYVHGTAEIEVTPSVKGLATLHDKDVLIFCISQLMAAVNAGRPVAPTLSQKTVPPNWVRANPSILSPGLRPIFDASNSRRTHSPDFGNAPRLTRSIVPLAPQSMAS